MVTSKLFEKYPELIVSPEKVTLPPYLPDTEMGREAMARMLSNVQLMDHCVGELIERLKADSLYDNSYIFFSVTMVGTCHGPNVKFWNGAHTFHLL